jgi:hypothetical protein
MTPPEPSPERRLALPDPTDQSDSRDFTLRMSMLLHVRCSSSRSCAFRRFTSCEVPVNTTLCQTRFPGSRELVGYLRAVGKASGPVPSSLDTDSRGREPVRPEYLGLLTPEAVWGVSKGGRKTGWWARVLLGTNGGWASPLFGFRGQTT